MLYLNNTVIAIIQREFVLYTVCADMTAATYRVLLTMLWTSYMMLCSANRWLVYLRQTQSAGYRYVVHWLEIARQAKLDTFIIIIEKNSFSSSTQKVYNIQTKYVFSLSSTNKRLHFRKQGHKYFPICPILLQKSKQLNVKCASFNWGRYNKN